MHTYTILDVFTDTPLEGNQVAVFDDGAGLDGELMQRTAREMNLSETVFLLGAGEDSNAVVRIFTPSIEMPFAGHPVLGTAFLVGERTGGEVVRLKTGAGLVPVALTREGGCVVYGEMEQPIPSPEPFERADELLRALRLPGSELPIEAYTNGLQHVYVALSSEREVAAVRPDLAALAELPIGVSCFAQAGNGRVKTRMFGPGVG